jgi:mono/diheme cytochrome c family protein
MKPNGIFYPLALSLLSFSNVALAAGPSTDSAVLERGRYLSISSGCNDCHTPGYMQTEGKVPQPAWLTGSPVGFQGPWGTTYPVNLRLYVQTLSQAEWLKRTREPMRPPMPWFNLREMNDADLIALYEYIRSLGPSGEPAPAAAPPGVMVTTPYFDFVPKNLPKQASRQ